MDNTQPINTCDECRSEYYAATSQMASLCPNCSHLLYGYENCDHQFEDGRCLKCFWDGSVSGFGEKGKQVLGL